MNKPENVVVTLPHTLMETVRLLASEKSESQFLAEVITAFVAFRLREVLIAGYQATAEESLAIAKEWESISNESWLLHVPPYEGNESSDDAPNQQDDVILKT